MKCRIVTGLLAAVMTAGAVPAGALSAHADGADRDFYEADDVNVRLLGRTYYSDSEDALFAANSASGVEFYVTGTQVTFNITVMGEPVRVGVYVNDKLVQRGMLYGNTGTKEKCSLKVPLSGGRSKVKLIKLSEAQQSTMTIDSIETDKDAALTPTPENSRKIEFIGDSITCGYGIDQPLYDPYTGAYSYFSTSTEDASKTYAYQLGEMFDADTSLFCASGYGVWCFYSGSRELVIPRFYEKCSPAVKSSGSGVQYFEMNTVDWDFSEYEPQCIVINLGTNDWTYLQYRYDELYNFTDSYKELLTMVRKNNPKAKVICTVGICGDGIFPQIEQAVEDYKTSADDSEVYTLRLGTMTENGESYGVDYHPMLATNKRVANDELAPFIADITGWETHAFPDDGTLDSDVPDVQTGEYHAQPAQGSSAGHTSGDADLNGRVNAADITLIAAHIKGRKTMSAENADNADVNGDGRINSADILKIAAHIKGLKKLN